MSQDAKLQADKFARALEDLAEVFDAMEKQAIDAAIGGKWQSQEGADAVHRLLERAKVIRDIRGNISNYVTLANAAEEKAEAGPSSYV